MFTVSVKHETGFEPAALALARRCSTTEPLVHVIKFVRIELIQYITTFVSCQYLFLSFLRKRVMGIEPTYLAWKASVLPLNYTRIYVKPFRVMPRAGIEPATRGFSVLCSTN